jgi:hypothetical protein
VSAILLVLGLALHLSPESAVRPAIAAIVLAGCLANLGRIGTHLTGGYLLLKPSKIRASRKPTVQRHLSGLVVANLALTSIGAAGAIMLMTHLETPLLLRVAPVALLCLAFYAIALATVERADELGLDRGTEIVRESRFGSWVFKIARKGTKFPPVRWLVELFDDPTPSDEPSTLALVIAAVLFFAPLAALASELGSALERQAIAALTDEKQGDDASGGEEKKPQEQPRATKPVVGSAVRSEVSDLQVLIGKTSADHPRTRIPLSSEDLPLVLAALPLIARWYEVTPASAKGESSIYILTRKDTTLFFKVIGK